MKSILKQFSGHDHGPFVQFIKYGISGGVATAVHIVVFYAMASWVFPAIGANDPVASFLGLPVADIADAVRARNSIIDNFITFILSNFTCYLINIFWVFESGRHNRFVEIGMFYAVSGMSMVVGSAVMGYLIKEHGLTTTVAFSANIVASLMINYVLRKFVIFRK